MDKKIFRKNLGAERACKIFVKLKRAEGIFIALVEYGARKEEKE